MNAGDEGQHCFIVGRECQTSDPTACLIIGDNGALCLGNLNQK